MLARLGHWIREFSEDKAVAPASDIEWAQTLAGLLVEAAMADGTLDDGERQQIARVLHGQLELDEADVGAMIDKSVADQKARVEIHGLTRAIRAETEPEDRVAIIEMVWMVVLADGELHDYEASLLRQVAGLLYVTDQESGIARKRARERLEN